MSIRILARFICLLFLLTCLFEASAQEGLRQRTLQISQTGGSIKSLLKAVSKASGVKIAYNSGKISLKKQIQLTGKEVTLEDYLKVILKDQPVAFLEKNGKIILIPQDRPLKQSSKQSTKQPYHTFSGYVSTKGSKEALIQAAVFVPEESKGIYTNEYGFFSLTLPEGTHKVQVSFVGHATELIELSLLQNIQMDILLESQYEMDEVLITNEEEDDETVQQASGKHVLELEKVQALPAILGEHDLIRVLQLLPGVQTGNEGTSGIYIRGGGPDQNLILMDGVPVYNANHLFGFVSVFNPQAVKRVELLKGGFPANYGGRLSSVLDVRMKEGNMEAIHGGVSAGLITTSINLEGPIKKEKTSFNIAARRTWVDLLSKGIQKISNVENVGTFSFYDINTKINHKFSNKSRLYFSAYLGSDRYVHEDRRDGTYSGNAPNPLYETKLQWGNKIAALRWNQLVNSKLFINTTATFSNYRYFIRNAFTSNETGVADSGFVREAEVISMSNITDWGIKSDVDYYPNTNHHIKFGSSYTLHRYIPTVHEEAIRSEGEELSFITGDAPTQAHEFNAYILDEFSLGQRLFLNAGVHLAGFRVEQRTYLSAQPRLQLRLNTGKNGALKASFVQMTQFIHLLSNAGIGLPSDLWVPSTSQIEPQSSLQYSLGYSQKIGKNWLANVEAYYKEMQNVLEYDDGASFFSSSENWQDKVRVGQGWAYGAEFLLEKKRGKLTGWIGYTLSWAERQFETLNFGEKFPFRYDRRHDLGMAVTYKPSAKIDYGLVWVYATGSAVTIGLERFTPLQLDDDFNPFFINQVTFVGERNNFRMRSYHRLDLSVNLHKNLKKGKRTVSFGLYNAYSRRNPFLLYTRQAEDSSRVGLFELSLLPVLPFVSYQYTF